MRVLFTFLLLFFTQLISYCQTSSGTLTLGTSTSTCATGCNASTTAPFCTTCGTNATGNCTEYALTETVTVPANSTVEITLTNANCGSSGGFDTNDEFTFLANGILTLVAGSGTGGQSTTKCYDNSGLTPQNVVFGYRSNRRDEFANWTYTIMAGSGISCTNIAPLPVSFSYLNIKSDLFNVNNG